MTARDSSAFQRRQTKAVMKRLELPGDRPSIWPVILLGVGVAGVVIALVGAWQ